MFSIFFNDFLNFILPTILLFFLISQVSFPISKLLFAKNQDEGLLNGITIGLLGISWISFLIATIAGIINLQALNQNSYLNIIISFFVWCLINYKVNEKYGPFNPSKSLKYFFIFVAALFFMYSLNSLDNIYGVKGSENPMNLGILNSLGISYKTPIQDFWMAGYSFNYYYFSHYVIHLICRVLNFVPNETFVYLTCLFPSLLIATFLNACMSIVKKHVSNLSFINKLKIYLFTTIFTFFLNPIYSLKAFFDYFTNSKSYIEILRDYSDYTIRIVPTLITENLNYGIFLNPLHSLTSALILGVLLINLLYYIFEDKEKINLKNIKFIALYIFLGFTIIMNTWDFIFYISLYFLGFVVLGFEAIKKDPKYFIKTNILFLYLIFLIPGPWYITFSAPAGLIGLVTNVTNILDLFKYFGLYIICFIFVIYIFKKYYSSENFKTINYFLYFSFLIILMLEIFYFKDYLAGGIYYRANTTYKFYNLVIFTLSFSFSIILGFLISQKQKAIKFLLFPITLLIFASASTNILFYSVKYKNLKYTGIKNQEEIISSYDNNLRQLINYLNQNKNYTDKIWEGSNESTFYSFNSLVSVFTGVPTVIGWYSHELTWRANIRFDKLVENRINDTKEFFTGEDLETARNLAKKYQVTYVVLSKSERDLYGNNLKENKLLQLGEVVFEKNDTKLIKINPK